MTSALASDNAAGIHPAVLSALVDASEGYAFPYGHDLLTESAQTLVADTFASHPDAVLFCATGTGANVLALDLLLANGRAGAVVCSDCAHILVDEAERQSATSERASFPWKRRTVGLRRASLEDAFPTRSTRTDSIAVLSVTQPTEYGTVYRADELSELREVCTRRGWLMHVDGARRLSRSPWNLAVAVR